ncbi:MAG TPA: hypothetical protein VMY37_12185 [Thermoguttaceae bacterium]|nr:hypothetical protein [Thermoguttaceae bacterium]
MAAVFPASHNTFIPDHNASNQMVIDFARNIKKFAVNRYCQIVPVEKVIGYYLKMTIEEAGRIVNTDLDNFVWPDGNDAPTGEDGLESFEFDPFRCERYTYAFRLGDLTISQASWNVVAQHASIKARQAMTARTQKAITALTTAGNYNATHVSAVSSITGNTGNWAQSTTARQDIKRSLNYAAEIILDDTLAAVELDDLVVVIDSALAADLAQTQEIVDYIKGTPDSLAQIRGELPGENAMYGLPNKLYGFPIIVEKTRKITTRKGATKSVSQILAKGTPFMAARPGGLIGVADAPNFSTCVIFEQEAMTVETVRDADNRRTKGRVVDTFVPKLVAPASGFLFTGAA